MNYLKHLIESKGGVNLLGRLIMVCRRFGLRSEKSIRAIQKILEITGRYGCKPSFFITADLLDRHKRLVELISTHEIDPCLHGHQHIDYSLMSRKAQTDDIRKGVETFRKLGIQVSGFRAPFLRFNGDTAKAAMDSDLAWVSHTCMLFREESCKQLVKKTASARHLLECFYTRKRHSVEPSIPYLHAGCVDIPVSLPDDEMMIDRIGIRDRSILAEIWLDMLAGAHRDGELFNFIIHPERARYIAQPLEKLLGKARSQDDVWIASVDEIGTWWKKRATFEFGNIKKRGDIYEVETNMTDNRYLVLQHPGGRKEFIGRNSEGTFIVNGSLAPVIGISDDCSAESISFLKREGFAVEPCSEPSKFAYVLNGNQPPGTSHRHVLEGVGKAVGPLVRFWRWPDAYQSALAITVDIDALSLVDFVRRAHHFFKAASMPVSAAFMA